MLLIIQVAIGVALGIFISFVIKSNSDYLKNNAEKYIKYFLLGCLLIGNAFYIETFINLSPKWISFINNFGTIAVFSDLWELVVKIAFTLVFIFSMGGLAQFILNTEIEIDNFEFTLFVYGLLNIDVMSLLHYGVLDAGIKYDLHGFGFDEKTSCYIENRGEMTLRV